MKKLFPLLLILVSCNCLPQIPPQYLPVDANCQAILPNYLQFFSIEDNCSNATLIQDPLPGTILDVSNPYFKVTITASDLLNTDEVKFDVFLLDTIAPKIIIDSNLLIYNWDHQDRVIDLWQKSLYSYLPDSVWMDKNFILVMSDNYNRMGTFIDKGLFLITENYLIECDSIRFKGGK